MRLVLAAKKMIDLPDYILKIFKQIESKGFKAYLVGGCVRDSLRGEIPLDFDLTSDATPYQIMEIFKTYPVLKTGIKHGTVTIIIDSHPIEITTHRIEGAYSDSRHPDSINYSKEIQTDLARRDFTINAMAYHPKEGLLDPYGGQIDLNNQIIRAVGDPQIRFNEDALRILRGLRFQSVLGFEIEEETFKAMNEASPRLKNISVERITKEMNGLLCGKNVKETLIEGISIIGQFIPELLPSINFDQKNPHHCHDLLTHLAITVAAVAPEIHLRWAMLLHDIGKPDTFLIDPQGVGHFHGHSKRSEELAKNILNRLRLPKEMTKQILILIKYHDNRIEANEKTIKRYLNKLGETGFKNLLEVQKSDSLGQDPRFLYHLDEIRELEQLLEKILSEKSCFSLKDLSIDGNDLISLGIKPGPEIGAILNQLLKAVIDQKIENDKNILLNKVKTELKSFDRSDN